MANLSDALARRAAERSLATREASYAAEMRRVIEATYRVIERTGSFDPTLREILRESGLSTQAFYRYFKSKDELLLVLLDDGRRQLVGYLEHRMARAEAPLEKIRAWIEGVLAQAVDPDAASRTRPFLANQDHLTEAFPDEQQASVELLLGLLVGALAELPGDEGRRTEIRRDAEAIYQLAFGTLHTHLTRRTQPGRAEIDHLVGFALRAVGQPPP
jgi:AcrR family transcriptional regulator